MASCVQVAILVTKAYPNPMLARQPDPAEAGSSDDEVADDQALADYEAGRFVSHEAVRAWILSWGTPDELPRPEIGD